MLLLLINKLTKLQHQDIRLELCSHLNNVISEDCNSMEKRRQTPNEEKASAAMRASATLNRIIDSI